VLGYLAGNFYATIEKTFGRATALMSSPSSSSRLWSVRSATTLPTEQANLAVDHDVRADPPRPIAAVDQPVGRTDRTSSSSCSHPGRQDHPSRHRTGPVITSTDHDIPAPVVAMASAHLGIHSGGMVLTERPVGEVVPMEHARMDKRTSFGTPERPSA
jgi:hypothetical protein